MKYFSYTEFISAKLSMVVMKTLTFVRSTSVPYRRTHIPAHGGMLRFHEWTVGMFQLTLTIRSIPLPASSRMFLSASQHALVLSATLPSTRLPWASAGIWPETQIWPAASMAWDFVELLVWEFSDYATSW